jgi:hypothetical protein
VRERLENNPETKDAGVMLTEVTLEGGRLHLGGVVPRAELKSRVEQAALEVAQEKNAGVLECVNDLRDPLDLVREAFPAGPPARQVALTDVRLEGDLLTIKGLVADGPLKDVVAKAARAKVEGALGPVVTRCDTAGLFDLREAVSQALAAEHKGVRLSAVRILERVEGGKKRRVVALTGTAPSRASAYAAAETAQALLNKHGFAIDDWDRHNLKIGADNAKAR